jgi:hypothetical protein
VQAVLAPPPRRRLERSARMFLYEDHENRVPTLRAMPWVIGPIHLAR